MHNVVFAFAHMSGLSSFIKKKIKKKRKKKNKKGAEDNLHHLNCAKRLWIGWDKTGDCADNQLPG